jgi:hypothetical protein
VALDEVLRRDAPSPHVADQDPEVINRQRRTPRRQLWDALEEARHQDQDRADGRGRHDPGDGAKQVAIASTGDGVQDEMQGAHDEVRDAEGHAVGAEGVRRRERNDEHRGHGAEHGEPDGPLFRVEGVGQPRVRSPRPPQRTKQQQAAEEPTPGRAIGEEPRDLRDREDDDQIEEQLKGRYPLSAFDGSIGHPETLASWTKRIQEFFVGLGGAV